MDDEVLYRSIAGRTTESEDRAIAEWRQASAENETLLVELSRLLALTASTDEQRVAHVPTFGAQEIIRRSRAQRANRRRATGRAVAWAGAAAAALMLAAGLWSVRGRPATPMPLLREIVTGPSDMVTVSLEDGSVVRLAPNSRLQSDTGKKHELALQGHAYFAVAKQKSGPLYIRTPAGVVQVVGTRFDLESTGDQLRLVVVEGLVLLSAQGTISRVSAGELAQVREGVPTPVVELPRTLPRLDWLGNFLAFEDTPVREAARDIEREFGVRVEIVDSALGARTVTGWFAGWTLHDVLDVVCVVADARCTQTGGVVTMRQRSSK